MLSNVKLSRLCRPTDGQTVKQYLPDLSIRGHKDWRVLHTRKNKGFFGKGIRGGGESWKIHLELQSYNGNTCFLFHIHVYLVIVEIPVSQSSKRNRVMQFLLAKYQYLCIKFSVVSSDKMVSSR